ncbi:MAG: sulfate adenylyltransferase subunit 1 [Rubrivivax sp.]
MKRDPLPGADEQDLGVLRFMTCGSVDGGKSTLIGRLLFDTKALLSDTLATLERHASRRGLSAVDLSLLTDGLIAEREQGITIDVAYRYFATARRKFIIADAPGHEQYTRNMVTAASTADVAVLLVDARKGLLPQTRRHATVAALLGVRQLILAVNKMDLVDGSQAVFDAIVAEFGAWLSQAATVSGWAAPAWVALPLSALRGDMVVDRGEGLGWYHGPTLMELLEQAPAGADAAAGPLRLPVQWVCRPSQGTPGAEGRGYAGRLESGRLAVGDEVLVLPSGQRSRVRALRLGERELQQAVAGQSVMVSLADERDISRGDLLVRADEANAAARTLEPQSKLQATVCWLGQATLSPARAYLLRHLTSQTPARVDAVQARLDIHALEWDDQPEAQSAPVALNDIVRLSLRLQQPVCADRYAEQRASGSFILVDPATNATVAAGVIG